MGGGGYSGGGAGVEILLSYFEYCGGGGSYCSGVLLTLSSGVKTGTGQVIITALATPCGSPEINVLGLGFTIPDGDVTPTTTDDTDFGSASVCTGTVDRTFVIQNTGSSTLTISSLSFSAGASADFTVISFPASVAAGSSSNLVVQFNPTATGLRATTLLINNNDSDENSYNFSIQGTGTDAFPVFTSCLSSSDGVALVTSVVEPVGWG